MGYGIVVMIFWKTITLLWKTITLFLHFFLLQYLQLLIRTDLTSGNSSDLVGGGGGGGGGGGKSRGKCSSGGKAGEEDKELSGAEDLCVE